LGATLHYGARCPKFAIATQVRWALSLLNLRCIACARSSSNVKPISSSAVATATRRSSSVATSISFYLS